MKLKRFYFDKKDLENDTITFSNQELLHANSVMRLKKDDELVAFCGDGLDYFCKILEINKNNFIAKVIKTKKNEADPKIKVTLFQALLKSDKLELITQKITELGINEFILFESEFCVSKIKENSNKIERLKKITIEATKQCGRSIPLKISSPIFFVDMIKKLNDYDLVIFAYEGQKDSKINEISGEYKNIAIIIGSEGGFSTKEYEELKHLQNVRCITLGNRILRAETASIITSALVMNKFEN